MKRPNRLRAAAGLGLLGLLLAAPSMAAEADDHEALRALRKTYEDAVNTERLELLKPHLSPDFSGVMVTGQTVASFEDLNKYWASIRELIGKNGKYTAALDPDRSIIQGDWALAKGTSRDRVVTGGGKEYSFQAAWTALCHREDGVWKLVRVQGTMDPLGNPFVKAGVRDAALKAGSLALGIGLIAGWLAARAFRRAA